MIQKGEKVVQNGGRMVQNGGRMIQNGGKVIQKGEKVVQNGGRMIQNGGKVIQNGGPKLVILQTFNFAKIIEDRKILAIPANTNRPIFQKKSPKPNFEQFRDAFINSLT